MNDKYENFNGETCEVCDREIVRKYEDRGKVREKEEKGEEDIEEGSEREKKV